MHAHCVMRITGAAVAASTRAWRSRPLIAPRRDAGPVREQLECLVCPRVEGRHVLWLRRQHRTGRVQELEGDLDRRGLFGPDVREQALELPALFRRREVPRRDLDGM